MRKKEKLLLRYSATEEELKEVFSYLEIGFIFIIFVVVLYLLYPKGMLQRQVVQEQSNYDLTAIYLKNMLRLEPNNINLIIATAKVLIKQKKLDLAKELIKILKKSKSTSQIKKKIYSLEFELLKTQKSETSKKKEKEKIDKELKKVLQSVAKDRAFDTDSAKRWYDEAIALNDKKDALEFLEPLNKKGDIDSLEKCVYIASEVEDKNRQVQCLEKLIVLEKEFPKKWILALYSLYVEQEDYKKAYKIAKDLEKTDHLFQSEPARVMLLAKDYKNASKEYLRLYEKEFEPQKKVDYLFKAVTTLSEGGYEKEAVKLAKKYQDRYLENDKIIERFIKFYLSINRLEDAKKLAEKILHIELIK